MNRKCILALALMLIGTNAWTENAEDGLLPEQASDEASTRVEQRVPAEATIRLMEAGEADSADAVTSQIELPAAVPDEGGAAENAARGLDIANQALTEGGLSVAEDALERSAGMAEEALEGREVPARAEDIPDRPEGIPETPEIPAGPGS